LYVCFCPDIFTAPQYIFVLVRNGLLLSLLIFLMPKLMVPIDDLL
jgi:hypothetical protein